MNKIHSTLAIAFVALSAGAFAQTDDVARKQRMDEAYVLRRELPSRDGAP